VPNCKLRPDPRITSGFAALCRRYSIDEWPQLWQIVTGTLALVGPRPLTAAELRKHYGSASLRIAQFKPGLVGLWQVRGRNQLTYRERRKLDLFMLDNWSLRLYIWILLASIPAVLSGRNAS
jgi:exopolysaccharide production protein ExoY